MIVSKYRKAFLIISEIVKGIKAAMKNRCILIFPKFDNEDIINDVRRRFDPSYKSIAPHITLVFPFESSISRQELSEHVSAALEGISCFDLKLHGIKRMDGENYYLMLGIREGIEAVSELHERLYTGILSEFKPNWPGGFMPHMTIGKFDSSDELATAYADLMHFQEVFSAHICRVSVEIIGKKNESIIEFEHFLKA